VPTVLSEYYLEQVRAAVDDFAVLIEVGDRVDHGVQFDDRRDQVLQRRRHPAAVRHRYRNGRRKHSARGSGFNEVACKADGRLLSYGNSSKVTVLDAAIGHVVMRRWGPASGPRLEAVISPDGGHVSTTTGRQFRVYEVASRAETFDLHVLLSGFCYGLRYSPDGTQIATLEEKGSTCGTPRQAS
jgi:hypothetical protein